MRDFSKQFLTEAFEENPGKFQEHYEVYRKYMDHNKPGYGQLLSFSTYIGGNKCPAERE